MNQQELRNFFEQDFPGAQVLMEKIATPLFGDIDRLKNDILDDVPEVAALAKRTNVTDLWLLGEIMLGNGDTFQFYDLTVADCVDLFRNRCGVQEVVRRLSKDFHGAFIFIHYKGEKGKPWRFSYCWKTDESTTSAKRHTYLFGRESICRTASQRFEILFGKAGALTSQDLTDAFSVQELSAQFYRELFAWYQWALSPEVAVHFPDGDAKLEEHFIRLLTRLMFVWFIKQKKLVPDDFFAEKTLKTLLKVFEPNSLEHSNYYNAILQNLFFATLNNEIGSRKFADERRGPKGQASDYSIKHFFRNPKGDTWFKKTNEEILALFNQVPYLNGGLFECLDKDPTGGNGRVVYSDGFSREAKHRALLPNALFFGDGVAHTGLLELFRQYNFTIEENSPDEAEISLDPELLGKVFENLLGTYNPETSETARKSSGSFYTPRAIVDFMVEKSLDSFLEGKTTEDLKQIKVLDPACGSGAFPMGMLNGIFKRLVPENATAKQRHDLKSLIIRNCIFGVDIQTIAVQISKLRFFISLVCEETPNDNPAANYGISPLPNLETRFVAADTLVKGTGKDDDDLFTWNLLKPLREELYAVKAKHIAPRSYAEKKKLRARDQKIREEMQRILRDNGWHDLGTGIDQLVQWDPYDQNTTAAFFNPQFMYGLDGGFDIIIGNPPYVQLQANCGLLAKKYKNCQFQTFDKTGDLYCLFYERGHQLLNKGGHLCFITSNKWMRAGYGETLRNFLIKNTSPKFLMDFAGEKIFESATVDVNILLFQKTDESNTTLRECPSCIATPDCRGKLSVYFGLQEEKMAASQLFATKNKKFHKTGCYLPAGLQD